MSIQVVTEPGQHGKTKFTASCNGYGTIHVDLFDAASDFHRGKFVDKTIASATEGGHDFTAGEIQDFKSQVEHAAKADPVKTSRFKSQRLNFAKFTTTHSELRTPIIDGICRAGDVVNLIAPPKVGKSWLALDLGMAVADGRPWLKHFYVNSGRVLYMDAELHPTDLSYRVAAIAEHRGFVPENLEQFDLEPFRGRLTDINVLQSEFFSQFEAGDFQLIIIDALYRFLPGGMSENDNSGMTQVYNTLAAIANRLQAAIICVHHSSKGNQSAKNQTDVGAGAGAISRAGDAHITIRDHDREGFQVLEAAVRSFPKFEPVSLHYTFPCWYVDAFEEPVLKQTQTANQMQKDAADKRDIAAISAEYPEKPFSKKQVAELLGCHHDKANRIIGVGVKNGSFKRHRKLKPKRSKVKVQTYKVQTDCADDCADEKPRA